MVFLNSNDLAVQLRPYNMADMCDDNMDLVDDAELTAIQLCKDYLFGLYNVDTIFSQTGNARHRSIMYMVSTIIIYILHERTSGMAIPDALKDNYDAVMKRLDDLSKGAVGLEGAPTVEDETGDTTIFYTYSKPRRTF